MKTMIIYKQMVQHAAASERVAASGKGLGAMLQSMQTGELVQHKGQLRRAEGPR